MGDYGFNFPFVSDASAERHKGNHAWEFVMELKKPLVFDKPHMVGLTEFHYTRDFEKRKSPKKAGSGSAQVANTTTDGSSSSDGQEQTNNQRHARSVTAAAAAAAVGEPPSKRLRQILENLDAFSDDDYDDDDSVAEERRAAAAAAGGHAAPSRPHADASLPPLGGSKILPAAEYLRAGIAPGDRKIAVARRRFARALTPTLSPALSPDKMKESHQLLLRNDPQQYLYTRSDPFMMTDYEVVSSMKPLVDRPDLQMQIPYHWTDEQKQRAFSSFRIYHPGVWQAAARVGKMLPQTGPYPSRFTPREQRILDGADPPSFEFYESPASTSALAVNSPTWMSTRPGPRTRPSLSRPCSRSRNPTSFVS